MNIMKRAGQRVGHLSEEHEHCEEGNANAGQHQVHSVEQRLREREEEWCSERASLFGC